MPPDRYAATGRDFGFPQGTTLHDHIIWLDRLSMDDTMTRDTRLASACYRIHISGIACFTTRYILPLPGSISVWILMTPLPASGLTSGRESGRFSPSRARGNRLGRRAANTTSVRHNNLGWLSTIPILSTHSFWISFLCDTLSTTRSFPFLYL